MDNPEKNLSKQDLFKIAELATAKRRFFDIGMSPIGDNIFKIINKEGIYLINLPIEINETTDSYFSAMYVSIKEGSECISFIGLNTADYYDKQIFALAHELYHHYEKNEMHICRISDDISQLYEMKANRFAAEFLLPTEKLENEIKEVNYGECDLKDWNHSALLRFIARLHCEYRLPYRAIVRRLDEIKAIKKEQYEQLIQVDARNEDSVYYRIGCAIKLEIFRQLNIKTVLFGTDGINLEKMVRNYDDGIISISELADALILFRKKLSDFGIEDQIDDEDLEEIREFLEE